jgi:hypothetical protein
VTIATTAHVSWSAHADDTAPGGVPVVLEATTARAGTGPVDAVLSQRMQRLTEGVSPMGDPSARSRIAAALHRLTGWDVFADDAEAERAYVSRLWAEDWDSPEDAVYDER